MKIINTFIALGILILLHFGANAQEIQWASSVRSIKKINSEAITASSDNSSSYKGFTTLEFSFKVPRTISQLIILKSHTFSRLGEIELVDEFGVTHLLAKNQYHIEEEENYTMLLSLERTVFKAKKVVVQVSSSELAIWKEVLTVGMADFNHLPLLKQRIAELELTMPDLDLLSQIKRFKLHDELNSEYAESKPLLSADGQTLYFCRQNHPDNIGGIADDQDIYFSEFKDGAWQAPQNMNPPLNNEFSNGLSTLAPDGHTMLLINDFSGKNNPAHGASIAHLGKEKWEMPEALEIEGFYNKSNYVDFYLANNGYVLLMAVERKDSYGDQDLYISTRHSSGKWSEPVNMGSIVNTGLAEFSPFLAPDNRTLFFASEGHNGMGNADIFFTVRLDNSWQNWTIPQNLGPEVNSSGYDAYFSSSLDMKTAYYVSTMGTGQSKDIYQLNFGKIKPKLYVLTGEILNKFDRRVRNARIEYKSMGSDASGEIKLKDRSNFELYLLAGDKYELTIYADNYIPKKQVLDLTQIGEEDTQHRNLELTSVYEHHLLDLNNILFVAGTSRFQSSSYESLKNLTQFLKENPTVKIRLDGFTDNTGPEEFNVELSEKRVIAVIDYLVKKGKIDRNRLTYKGFGPKNPVASNETLEGRKKNRRVEAVIVEF